MRASSTDDMILNVILGVREGAFSDSDYCMMGNNTLQVLMILFNGTTLVWNRETHGVAEVETQRMAEARKLFFLSKNSLLKQF